MGNQRRSFGLIGYPLGHSYSKGHFARKFEQEGIADCSYENFEIPSVEMVRQVVSETEGLIGLNVTIPYKQSVIAFLDELDPVAREIGAVNTIKISRSPTGCYLAGHNTDVIGFERSLEPWHPDSSLKALVFGTGGSSMAVKHVLKKLGVSFIQVSRKGDEGFTGYESITREIVRSHLLWVNCTPVGMFPRTDGLLPLPYHQLTPAHYLFDLVYNPEITGFLKKGIEAGASILNGSRMLYEQAEASWAIWNR